MHRLPLLLCAIALLGSSASAVLYFRIGNSKQVLESRLADAATRATKLDADLAAANEQNGALKGKVTALDAELQRTSAKLTTVESRASQLDRELAEAKSAAKHARDDAAQARDDAAQSKAVLSLYESTSRALADEVAALRQDLADTRAANASPEAVAAYKNTIAELERQLAAARNGTVAPGTAAASTAVFTSRSMGRATVLTVGPESAFVVLNFGSARGAQLGQKLNVSQGNTIVATVLISDVRTNFSVAQVLPDTLRGVLQKGDSAVLLR